MMHMDESRMESSRKEARTAKAIAVEKYKAGDLAGAKAFAIKAKSLDPALCGLICLITVLDVMIPFEKKLNGEVDWYSILAVEPTADIATIKKSYSRLFMNIIMENDKEVGSIVEATNILDESWSVLCNEKKRLDYDKRRGIQPQVQNPRIVPNLIKGTNSSSSDDDSSFWARCHHCSFTYKYSKSWKDQRFIICVKCSQPFEAVEYRDPWSCENQQIRRETQVPSVSLTYNPVVLSAPKPVAKRQRLVDKGKRVSVPVNKQRRESQVPSLAYTPIVFSAPAQTKKMFNEQNEELVEVIVEQMVTSTPLPVFKSQRTFDQPKMFNEENEEIVEVIIELAD
ncbi:hypothetical protein EUTSA_v10015299mg [Eutrema salsugineum]|uniref:J domain-containing protein n=1 Tax=Eutrema salsugineum TaxID=72664 RepID=V4LIK4_EUTSA|nr:hypothetical protein EUTSA_v10015299mg [Eutrema salsugineum]